MIARWQIAVGVVAVFAVAFGIGILTGWPWAGLIVGAVLAVPIFVVFTRNARPKLGS